MSRFKLGDRVKCISSFASESRWIGMTGTVVAFQDTEHPRVGVSFDNCTYGHNLSGAVITNSGRWGESESLELIEEKTTIMKNLKTTFKNLFRSEPEKSMIKAGILDEQENLTADGSAIFIDWLFSQNKVKFNEEVVTKLLAEDKEDK